MLHRTLHRPFDRNLSISKLVSAFIGLLLLSSMAIAQLGFPRYDYWSTFDNSGPRIGSSVAVGDFNGDEILDIVTGAPDADNAGVTATGEVYLRLVAEDGSSFAQSITTCYSDLETGAHLGTAVAFGDFDNDGDDDLVIGRPGATVSSKAGAGVICVIHGGGDSLALSPMNFFSQYNLPDEPETNDHFGASLAVGDLNGDGYADLAVGSPGEDIGVGPAAVNAAGAVHVLFGGPDGLSSDDPVFLYRGAPGVGWSPEANERFGSALAIGDFQGLDDFNDLAVGAPGDNPAGIGGSVTIVVGGAFNPLSTGTIPYSADGAPYDLLTTGQPYDNFGAALAAGDFDGDGDDDLAVGIPGDEEFAAAQSAGAVMVLYRNLATLSDDGEQVFFESLFGGVIHDFDLMGKALTAGDFDHDGRGDLVIASPGFDGFGVANSGKVVVLYGTDSGLELEGFQAVNMGLFGGAEINENLGASLATGKLFGRFGGDDLLIGMPGRFGDTGATLIVQSLVLFADGFESGDPSAWSAAVP